MLRIFIVVLTAGLTASTVSAHEIDGKNIPIIEGIRACTELVTVDERVDCFTTLCTPSYQCMEALLVAATEDDGPEGGIAVLSDIMEQHELFALRTDGHELAHVVGRQAARHYGSSGDVFLRCGSDFFYGCQHGFFEIALAQSQTPLQAATNICESLDSAEKFFCYHGVGHGMMMAKGNDLQKVIDVCDTLPDTDASRQACWQGSFMENMNSYLRGEARPGVFDPGDPLAPCSRFPEKYQWECYYNHAAYLVDLAGKSLPKAATLCLKAAPASVHPCMRGLGQFTSNPGWQRIIIPSEFQEEKFIENAAKLCAAFPEDYQHDCATGAANNLVNYRHHDQAMQFCSLLSDVDGQRTACYREMITILSHPEHSPEERAKVCSLMPNTLKAECTKAIVPPSSRAQRDSEKNPGILRSIVQSIREVLRIFLRFIDVFGLLTPENALSIAHSSSSIAASSSATIIGDVVIHYRAHAFYPPDVKIAAGQTVTWINDGEEAFWPAGDDHPTHIVYDGGAFDPQAPVGAGKNWSFTFTEKGTWGFHDHLYPRAVGSVVVK